MKRYQAKNESNEIKYEQLGSGSRKKVVFENHLQNAKFLRKSKAAKQLKRVMPL